MGEILGGVVAKRDAEPQIGHLSGVNRGDNDDVDGSAMKEGDDLARWVKDNWQKPKSKGAKKLVMARNRTGRGGRGAVRGAILPFLRYRSPNSPLTPPTHR